MNDDLYLIVVGVMVLIPTLGTLLGMHRDEQFHRLIRASIDRIGGHSQRGYLLFRSSQKSRYNPEWKSTLCEWRTVLGYG